MLSFFFTTLSLVKFLPSLPRPSHWVTAPWWDGKRFISDRCKQETISIEIFVAKTNRKACKVNKIFFSGRRGKMRYRNKVKEENLFGCEFGMVEGHFLTLSPISYAICFILLLQLWPWPEPIRSLLVMNKRSACTNVHALVSLIIYTNNGGPGRGILGPEW